MSKEQNKRGHKSVEPLTQHLFEPPVENQVSRCEKHDEVCYPHVGCLSCYVEIVNTSPLTGDSDAKETASRAINSGAGIQVF